MPRYQLDFAEPGDDTARDENGTTEMTGAKSQRGGPCSGGCYVSVLVGCVLLVLCLVLVAGVALAVFFASSRDLNCTVEGTETSSAGTGGVDAVVSSCQEWVGNGGIASRNICRVCPPVGSNRTTPTPTATATTAAVAVTTTTSSAGSVRYRLPDNVRPKHYQVNLQPQLYGDDPRAFYFNGSGVIRLECVRATDLITLHVKGLDISDRDIHVQHENSPQHNIFRSSSYDEEKQFLQLQLTMSMVEGQMYLIRFLGFTGALSTAESTGLYLRHYRDGPNTVYVATSLAEPVYFRKIFPSFDEPQLKAKFDVAIARRNDTERHYVALSNGALDRTVYTEDAQGNVWAWDTFETTPLMSTYMVTVTVCDFVPLQNTLASNQSVTFRTLLSPEAVHLAPTVHRLAMTLFLWIGQQFKPPYGQAFSTFDNVAMTDLKYIGVDHMRRGSTVGAILNNPDVISADHQLQLAFHTARKIMHTWFGVYVSPEWWNWTWLDEGLSTWCSLLAFDHVFPQWTVTRIWMSTNLPSVMESDALLTSRALSSDVDSPADVTAMFDDVTFTKGAAVMRMMQFIMGQNTFIDGLNLYIRNNLYGNTKPSHLFDALDQKMQEENFGPDYVSSKMESWVTHPGYPVVMVTRTAQGYQLTQKRFLIGPEKNNDRNYQWEIPITYATSENSSMTKSRDDIVWLSQNKNLIIPASVDDDAKSWILININHMTYCRVLYDNATWHALIGQLTRDPKVIPSVNRGQIIDDAWALAEAGMVALSAALSTLDVERTKEDLLPWAAFIRIMASLEQRLYNTDLFPLLQAYIQKTIAKSLRKMNFNIDLTTSPSSALVKQRVADLACRYGSAACVNVARRLFSEWRTTGINEINVNFRRHYYCAAVAEGDVTDWEFAYTRYASDDVSTAEANNLGHALSCSNDPTLLGRLLSAALDASENGTQDLVSALRSVSANPSGRPLAFRFLMDHWDTVMTRLDTTQLSQVLMDVTSGFSTEYQLLQLEQLPKMFNVTKVSEVLARVISRTRENKAWLETHYDVIKDWLTPKKPTPTRPPTPRPPPGSYRLPSHVVPYHYDLSLQPHMDLRVFEGNVTIYVTCTSATDVITLHQDGLTIDPAFITVANVISPETSLPVENVTEVAKFHFYKIHMLQPLKPGQNYSLRFLNFRREKPKMGRGLYFSAYMNGSESVYVASTQMEPTFARQVFPCFDEPALKATFYVTLVRRTDADRHYVTLSNMPQVSSQVLDGSWTADHYQQTMVMPTYLLAFVVCDYSYLANMSSRYPVEIRTYAQSNRIGEARYAQDHAVELFDWFNDHFEPKYQTFLSKLDNIAIPYFEAGAMENWGLITYKRRLLYSPLSLADGRYWVARVPSHEIAHMWFGNTVSPKWWTWTWLNEAFANYWQTYAVEQLYPDWKSQSVYDKVTSDFTIMNRETQGMTHPLNHAVDTPAQIRAQFDGITYVKGGEIIGMMHMIMGEHFIPALNTYLNDHALGNADDKDLFNSLNKYISTQADIDVNMTEKMDSWVNQKGYPLVTVHRQGGQVILTQRHILKGSTSSNDTGLFEIPITYTTSSEKNFNKPRTDILWLRADGLPLTIQMTSPNDSWVVINLRHEGYYRVNYDVFMWKALIDQLNTDHTVFHQVNRATLIEDAFYMFNTGLLPLEVALHTLNYMKKEVDFGPWRVFFFKIQTVDKLLDRTDLFPDYQRFAQGLVEEPLQKIGFDVPHDNNPPIVVEKMTHIITYACKHEHKPCVAKATSMVSDWMKTNNNTINMNLRSTVYCTAVRAGDYAVWKFILDRSQDKVDTGEKSLLRSALGCSKDPSILYSFLAMCLDDKAEPSSSELPSCVEAVAGNRYGREVAVNFVMERFPSLLKRFSRSTVASLVQKVTGHFHSKFHLAQLQFMRDTYDVSGLERFLDRLAERTVKNMKWLDRNLDTIRRWLKNAL